jgi:hypothetical protein
MINHRSVYVADGHWTRLACARNAAAHIRRLIAPTYMLWIIRALEKTLGAVRKLQLR